MSKLMTFSQVNVDKKAKCTTTAVIASTSDRQQKKKTTKSADKENVKRKWKTTVIRTILTHILSMTDDYSIRQFT